MRATYEARIAQSEAELAALRQENARMQGEMSRYTTSSNPLPRPPEHIPLVTSLSREVPAPAAHSSQRSPAPLGLGLPTTVAPSSQSRTSSNGSNGSTGSRHRAPSVHFADPGPSNDREQKSRYKVTADGAPYSQRVIPPRLEGSDIDVTPRPLISAVPTSQRPIPQPVYYPAGAPSAPRVTDTLIWINGIDPPRELTTSEKQALPQLREHSMGYTNSNPVSSTVVPSVAPSSSAVQPPIQSPPVIPPPPMMQPTLAARPAAETGSARVRITAPDPPIEGRDRHALRQGPANKEGYVKAYLPHMGGIGWIREEEAAKLPVRARGTESRYPYVIAKELSEVDDDWRRDGGSSAHNPLQLSGMPEAPMASSSRSAVQQSQYNALPESSTAASTLFRNPPPSSDRAAPASANSSSTSLSGMPILTAPSSTSRTSSGRRRAASNAESLGLNLTSLPMPRAPQTSGEPPATPSAASSWGTMESRNNSLGDLQLNNFRDPNPYTRAESLEQLPIGELNGGPIVLTDTITPRQGPSILDDDRSVSGRSIASRDHHAGASAPAGLLLNPSSGSSRVVGSLQDLEEVNRSLQQLAESQSRESSRHHSRQPSGHSSLSRDESGVLVGSRTGLALYSSRPSQPSSNNASSGPSPDDQSPPAESRPRSGASTRSHAESTYSHQSSHSHHSSYSAHTSASHRSSSDNRKARRASNASLLNGAPEHVATWTPMPSDMQSYGSSRGPYVSESRPPPSQESIPRSLQSNGDGLGLTFEAPSTSSAVTGSGEQAAGIHAPRPVNGRRASQLIGGTWNARSGH
ncbi:hypothetical protein BD309DRAFT_716479 [Dichomitus squalens]|nr:hypothetical protein BD309DRAFT_716479 [Dichomitus squalens]